MRKEIESMVKNEIKDAEFQRRALDLVNKIYVYIDLDQRKIETEKKVKEIAKREEELKKKAAEKKAKKAKAEAEKQSGEEL